MSENREFARLVVSQVILVAGIWLLGASAVLSSAEPSKRVYDNRLTPIDDGPPILADHPEFIAPVTPSARYLAPPVIDDPGATLAVRSWRFSYNARGVIEMENRLDGKQTALIVVHPWGIDDAQGWRTPQPAGCAFQCTPEKNALCRRHARQVINPLVQRLRKQAAVVMYSLPGVEDAIRGKMYRSMRGRPSTEDRAAGVRELAEKLKHFPYKGEALPKRLTLSAKLPAVDYFRQFPGLSAGDRYNGAGFWKLPIPVMSDITTAPNDVVIYDAEGYELLRDFLRGQGVRHVLLAGYNTDMCVCSTTAGYKNLRGDFNVMLIGDATLATFPANNKPAIATNAAVSFASLNLFITQSSWIKTTDKAAAR